MFRVLNPLSMQSIFFLILCLFLFRKKKVHKAIIMNNSTAAESGRGREKNQKIQPDGKNEALLDDDANDSSRKVGGGLSFFFFLKNRRN